MATGGDRCDVLAARTPKEQVRGGVMVNLTAQFSCVADQPAAGFKLNIAQCLAIGTAVFQPTKTGKFSSRYSVDLHQDVGQPVNWCLSC